MLQRHIELQFEDGVLDGHEGFNMPVKSGRLITTLRGEVESWIPHDQALAIYRAGHLRATLPPDQQDQVRLALDQAGLNLFTAVGMQPHLLSRLLLANRPPEPLGEAGRWAAENATGEDAVNGSLADVGAEGEAAAPLQLEASEPVTLDPPAPGQEEPEPVPLTASADEAPAEAQAAPEPGSEPESEPKPEPAKA